MLARSFDEVIDIDALMDLYAATARMAVKDFEAGPDAVGPKHYESARYFLEVSGLMSRIAVPPAHASMPRQLGLFDMRRGDGD